MHSSDQGLIRPAHKADIALSTMGAVRREENELQEIRQLKIWDSSAIKRDARLARQCNNIRESTFYVSSLAAEADVVEASYGEAAVLI